MSILRLIPVLFIKNGLIVRSQQFSKHQIIGNVISQAERLNEWNADELIYIDISRDKQYDARRDDKRIKSMNNIIDIIQEISKVCFMPLSFGGGIRSVSDAVERIRNGADKIIVNRLLHESKEIVKDISRTLGAQAIIGSIDYQLIDGTPIVFSQYGNKKTNYDLFEFIKICEDIGIGEIFLQNIQLDGSAQGFDQEIIEKAVSCTGLPVIACSGAGLAEQFSKPAKIKGLSALAAGNIFNFTERAYPNIKKYLKEDNVNVR